MKEKELREAAECALCRKPFGHTALPTFWRVTVERLGVNISAIQRQTHLAGMLGSAKIAAVMGPDQDMTMPVLPPTTMTVCESCAPREVSVFELAEAAQRQIKAKVIAP